MVTLADLGAGGRPLFWQQPEMMVRNYELRTDDRQIAATLQRQPGFRAPALIEAPGGRWLVSRSGMVRLAMAIRSAGDNEEVATYASPWGGGGTLTFVRGVSYDWKASNLWRTRWAWHGPDGRPLVRFVNRRRLMRREGEVVLEPAALRVRELDLLVAVGWYLQLLFMEGSAAKNAADAVIEMAVAAGS